MAPSSSIALASIFLAAMACSRRASAPSAGAARQLAGQPPEWSRGGDASVDGPDKQETASREASIKDLDRFMAGVGWRFAHSPEDDRLTTIVETFMKKAHHPLPENPRFVIAKRKDGWGVFVLDFEAFLRGERPQFDTFHIGNKGGRPQLLYIEAGI